MMHLRTVRACCASTLRGGAINNCMYRGDECRSIFLRMGKVGRL